MASDAQIAHEKSDERQKRGFAWALSVYGDRVRSRRYQAFRGLEEFLELVQTQGLTLEDVIRTAEYVYERPAGDTKVEFGDVRLSLDIMAENLGVSTDGCLTSTLTRIQALDPAKCLAKDDEKCRRGLI